MFFPCPLTNLCFQIRGVRGGTTTGSGAAPPRPRASVARATGTILVTGGGMTGELVYGCGVAEVLCDSDDQCSVRDLVTGWRAQ